VSREVSSLNSSQHNSVGDLYSEYDPSDAPEPNFPPTIAVINARSLYNKSKSLITFIKESRIDIAFISETWERADFDLKELLNTSSLQIESLRRISPHPGGGVAIIINNAYSVEKLNLSQPPGIEVIWRLIKIQSFKNIQRIAVAAIYVPPRSRKKADITEYLMSSVHYIKSKFNDIKFLLGGDINNLDLTPVLDCYQELQQIVTTPTLNNRILDVLVTDMKEAFYPPFVRPPLECNDDDNGESSDHKIVLCAPRNININPNLPPPTFITYRPIPQSGIEIFGRFITTHHWEEVFNTNDINNKVQVFHSTIREKLDEIFPEKTIKVTALDKAWMNPQLKQLLRKIKREYWKNRKSLKWRNLKRTFSKLKKMKCQTYYSNILNEIKTTNQSKWFDVLKKIGLKDRNMRGITIECFEGLSDVDVVNNVATHFASISQEYDPICLEKLPAFLPAEEPPILFEYEVCAELKKMKKTKSTLPIDLPYKLRSEFAAELSVPLTHIFNACLKNGIYPDQWKFEWVTPIPKIASPKVVKDLRKISCTSDYSKLFERFLKKWIDEDIKQSIDKSQFGNQKGTGTEHLLVTMIDRILSHLDQNTNSPAVILTMLDWSAAFDRQCPNIGIRKFQELGVRSNILNLLTSYLSNRFMCVKLNGVTSQKFHMPGGVPKEPSWVF